MVSFSCENCGDVLTKKKLDPHRNQCRGANYTCLDCMVHFQGTDYRSHTSCMSEAQKYQGALYKEKPGKNKGASVAMQAQERAVVPRKAYVEDEAEDGTNALAVIDVPPKAPSPPPNPDHLVAGVDVFDYLVKDGAPTRTLHESRRTNGNSQDSHYAEHGYTYGHAPLQPSLDRYGSWTSLHDPAALSTARSMPPPLYDTPAPRRTEREARTGEKSKSDKKRKRHQLDELDMARVKQTHDQEMTDAPPVVLHSGLTGGLNRLLARPSDELEQQLAPSPLSPLKRTKKDSQQAVASERQVKNGKPSSSKREKYHDTNGDFRNHETSRLEQDDHEHKRRHRRHRHRDSSSSEDHQRPTKKQVKRIEYKISSSEPASRDGNVAEQELVSYRSPADLFMSFVTKGPDSDRGMSINKALKRYHREMDDQGLDGGSRDKELWKGLRVRRNERGEIVLFV